MLKCARRWVRLERVERIRMGELLSGHLRVRMCIW